MSDELPLHVQMLLALKVKVQRRQREHQIKTGKGLGDQEYQRHVGRIAECDIQIITIDEMLKTDVDDVADFLEQSRHERSIDKRHPARNRAG